MFALIWVSLLLIVGGSITGTSLVIGDRPTCQKRFCITLPDREIPAEARLCAVIPCSFSAPYYLTPQHIVWYKCDFPHRICRNDEIIFNSNNNQNVQPGFSGRVSLLKSDVSQQDCSIVINDLKESDSGYYQLRVESISDGFQYSRKAVIAVQGLKQKPMVEVPPLRDGEESTVTCTAPGLCYGSVPGITWTWSRAAGIHSHIPGKTTTAFRTEDVRGAGRRRSSTLTFKSSAELHGTNVTCRVSFSDDTITEETATLNVTYIRRPRISGSPTVLRGATLNLNCSVESSPPSLVMWTKLGDNRTLQNETGSAALVLPNVTPEDSGQYVCTVKHLNTTSAQYANVTVTCSAGVAEHRGLNAALLLTIAAVSLVFNVVFIISLVVLWNSKKKVKPAEADRTYMSLHTADRSSEYDVIGTSQN